MHKKCFYQVSRWSENKHHALFILIDMNNFLSTLLVCFSYFVKYDSNSIQLLINFLGVKLELIPTCRICLGNLELMIVCSGKNILWFFQCQTSQASLATLISHRFFPHPWMLCSKSLTLWALFIYFWYLPCNHGYWILLKESIAYSIKFLVSFKLRKDRFKPGVFCCHDHSYARAIWIISSFVLQYRSWKYPLNAGIFFPSK